MPIISDETLRRYRESLKRVKVGKIVSDETLRQYIEEQKRRHEPMRLGFSHWNDDPKDDEIARLKKRIKELEARDR
jgi:hypothetical protein